MTSTRFLFSEERGPELKCYALDFLFETQAVLLMGAWDIQWSFPWERNFWERKVVSLGFILKSFSSLKTSVCVWRSAYFRMCPLKTWYAFCICGLVPLLLRISQFLLVLVLVMGHTLGHCIVYGEILEIWFQCEISCMNCCLIILQKTLYSLLYYNTNV